ncbi:tyrosine-protein kinase receptor torso [Drosophila grimshawi]|uniref:receptor protein-tyrosine kinase n=1 Tax=Drosophila grimshawi TaxID=7222 RepID=B4J806_DROGR|nr:tyrosine-protein kinase receptor torso [Drosophila grimshawi]EDW02236.1 GH20010 [Drosophila grimshawi]
MLVLYAKYAFIFWLLRESDHGDLELMRQLSEDKTLLKVSACTKRCLQTTPQKKLNDCLEHCQGDNSTDLMPTSLRRVQENFLLKLVCRTESKLSFRIHWVQHERHKNATTQKPPDAVFIIRTNDKMESQIFLSDDSFFTIPELESDTTYNITAHAVHADGAYSLIAEEAFQTLRRGYQPSKMGEVKLRRFLEQPDNLHSIAAEVEWQPSADRNCYFDMIYYSTDTQSMETPTPVEFRDPRQLYTYIISNMTFGEQFKVGVRTVNDRNMLESPVQWLILQAPSCLDWFNNSYVLCAPLKPSNLKVEQQHFDQNILALNVSWSAPKYPPDNYTLHILHNDDERAKFAVDQNASYYYISNITVLSDNFEVVLDAHTQGGTNASMVFLIKAPLASWLLDSSLIKWLLFLLVCISCILVLCFLTLNRHKRQECPHLDTKDLKAAPNQSSDFHLSLINSSSLLATLNAEDDELEVEPHAVLLQDVLGEGAFGLVRRGVYKQRQVAVKLLKDHPNEEDVQAFKCEIQMLRAVGRHPNIVGIVGYSTRFSNRMMLLTEYCGLGSLQSFLRDEWKFQQERNNQDVRPKLQPAVAVCCPVRIQQRSGRLLDNSTRIEDINISMLSTLEEENESDLSRDSHKLTKLVNAADNKSYGLQEIENLDANPVAPPSVASLKAILKRNALNEQKSMKISGTVSFENQEYFEAPPVAAIREPLKYADLLDIAQQVAVGMDFLAQNKIVHRDLAARNVLISLDRTIKIADFGLSRDVYHENVYRKSGGSGKLPIKWLALESLTHQVYTSQSDVWSFGVLLYEITTLGGMPYPSISPRDLLQLLRQGHRMKRPDGCTDELFALMESCWCSIPANRPTFAELKLHLDAMIIATNELPLRLLQQRINQANEQPENPHSKVEQLPPDDVHYLQPLN